MFEIIIKKQQFSGLKLGYSEGEPVLALHGWMDNAASFIPLSQYLKDIQLLAIDLAGHGQSAHRPEGVDYTLWSYVEDTIHIIEALGYNKVGLIGHSLGAIIAVMVAAVRPELITKVVLLDGLCPMPSPAEKSPQVLSEYLRARQKNNQSKPAKVYSSLDGAVAARAQGKFPVSVKSAKLLVERAMINTGQGWQWCTDPRLSMPSPVRLTLEQSLSFPESLTCECHLFYSKQGLLNPLVNTYEKKLSHIQMHAFEGNHHFHMEEQAANVANEINKIFS